MTFRNFFFLGSILNEITFFTAPFRNFFLKYFKANWFHYFSLNYETIWENHAYLSGVDYVDDHLLLLDKLCNFSGARTFYMLFWFCKSINMPVGTSNSWQIIIIRRNWGICSCLNQLVSCSDDHGMSLQ